MPKIRKDQVDVDWAKLGTIERQDYLYELIQRMLIDQEEQGFIPKDEVLLNELSIALKDIKN